MRHCAAAEAWEREQKAIAARADQQHAWALAGDPRGNYGVDYTRLETERNRTATQRV